MQQFRHTLEKRQARLDNQCFEEILLNLLISNSQTMCLLDSNKCYFDIYKSELTEKRWQWMDTTALLCFVFLFSKVTVTSKCQTHEG